MPQQPPDHPEGHARRPGTHPSAGLLEGFLRGDLGAAERRAVVRHLLSGCPQCVAVTRRGWLLGSPPEGTHDNPCEAFAGLADGLDRRQRRLSGEHDRAPRLLAEILAHSRARRLALVCGEERFRSLALSEILLERSRLEASRDPVQAAETAELAVALADRLDARVWGATLTDVLRARSWAYLGEARRLAADLRGAERALAVAEVLLEKTGPDPLDRAELLCLQASLAQDQRRLDEAGRLLDRALKIYRRAGDRRLQAQALLQMGLLRGAVRRKQALIEAAGREGESDEAGGSRLSE